MIFSVLPALLSGKNLSHAESAKLFETIFSGSASDSQIKTALLLLARKGETADEVSGCLEALKRNEPQIRERIPGLLDTCGTGGDQSYSINVSTLAAIVAAGAGCKVAKHGNRAFSSRCGSSDLMEALGVKLDASPKTMIKAIKEAGIGYFHAPFYHPAISKLQAVRKQIKMKTIFNLLGPLANPMPLAAKVAGVSNQKNFELFTGLLKKTGLKRALVVYSKADGMDEISAGAPTRAVLIDGKSLKRITIKPRTFGIRAAGREKLVCKSLAESKAAALKILQGKAKGPMLDVVLLNAGAAIWVSGKARNLQEGIEIARQSIKSGRAYQALKGLVKISRQ